MDRKVSFVIYSDGSGWSDGITGYCALIRCTRTDKENIVMGACTNSTVPRSELTAITEALRWIYGSAMFFDGISIDVFTDNKQIAESAMFLSRRNESRDLWLQYDFFAEKMDMQITHIGRNSASENRLCDVHASTLRCMLQEYTKQTETSL